MNRTDLIKAILSMPKGVKWLDSAKTIFQLDYIESSGTEYIDTGYKPNSNSIFKTKTINIRGENIFGNGLSSPFFAITIGTTFFVNTARYLENAPALNVIHTYEMNNIVGKYIIDNEEVANWTPLTGTSAKTTNLFRLDSTYGRYSTIKMYYFQIYDNDIQVRNFLPAYNTTTNECGMYDTINKVWYGNAGTGAFTSA